MIIARSALATLVLGFLLWPLTASAAPVPVSGTITVNPPLTVNSYSRARFFLVREGAAPGDFGISVHSQQVFGQTFNYSFSLPDGSMSPGVAYRLTVFVVNNTSEARAGYTTVTPSGGTRLDFTAGSYRGTLPPDSAGLVALVLGLALATVAGGLALWRQMRLRRPARQAAAA
jgi:hypothetical protein